jgi:predicted nucleotidyltransferase
MCKIELDAIAAALENETHVIAAWIFGSAQKGMIPPGSDLDIGVLFTEKPSLDVLTGLRASLQAETDFDEIDLVSLNEATVILRFEAISGQPVYCRDLDKRAEFASLTAREYESEMALLEWGLKSYRVAQATKTT